jgi:hypothetical protein
MSNTVFLIKRSNTTGVPAANTLNTAELAYSYSTGGATGSGVLFIGPRYGVSGASPNAAINIGGSFYTTKLDNSGWLNTGTGSPGNTFVWRDANGSIYANAIYGNIVGTITLSDGSVTNAKLQNSTIQINTGIGLSTNLAAIPLGGTAVHSINIGDGLSATSGNGSTLNVDSTVVRTTGVQTIGGAKTFTSDVTINANLTVAGAFVTVNANTITVEDPILTLGAGPSANLATNDGMDRGIAFMWYNGGFGGAQANTQNTGFFGWSNTSHRFRFLPDAGNSAGVWSGTDGDAQLGRILLGDSNLAAPSLSWTNEGNTGFFRSGGGEVSFVTRGIVSEVANQTGTFLSNNYFQVLGNVALGTYSTLFVDNVGGRIGIGTRSMDTLLTVSGNVGSFAVANITSSAVTNTNVHIIGQNGAQGGLLVDAFAGIPILAGRRADGNIAIPLALATDDKLLSIRGYAFGTDGYDANTLAAIEYGAGQTFTNANKGTYIRFLTTALSTNTGAVEHVRIDPAGNVGINTTAPTANLHVVGSLLITGNVNFQTALGVGQGGTGQSVFGANSIILGNGAAGFNQALNSNTQGQILQVDVNGNPAFGMIDAGVF